jgi:hypothetical protein
LADEAGRFRPPTWLQLALTTIARRTPLPNGAFVVGELLAALLSISADSQPRADSRPRADSQPRADLVQDRMAGPAHAGPSKGPKLCSDSARCGPAATSTTTSSSFSPRSTSAITSHATPTGRFPIHCQRCEAGRISSSCKRSELLRRWPTRKSRTPSRWPHHALTTAVPRATQSRAWRRDAPLYDGGDRDEAARAARASIVVTPDFETARPFWGTRGPRNRLISIPWTSTRGQNP